MTAVVFVVVVQAILMERNDLIIEAQRLTGLLASLPRAGVPARASDESPPPAKFGAKLAGLAQAVRGNV